MKLSFLAEFADRDREEEYYLHELSSSKRYIRNVVLGLGLIYFFFLIPDFAINHKASTLLLIVATKALMLVLVVAYFLFYRLHGPSTGIQYCLAVYELLFAMCYLLTVCAYENPNYLIKSMDVILIIIAFNLIPTKWKFNVAGTAVLVLAFFAISPSVFRDTPPAHLWAGRVYISIVFALTAVSSHRLNCARRQNYLIQTTLERSAQTDPMTGIYNRARFDKDAAFCEQRYRELQVEYSIIMFDFDHFKYINDTYGHTAGDEMIQQAVNLIGGAIRDTDVFVRWGGDEFILLLPNTAKEQACTLAERLRVIVDRYEYRGDDRVSCSFSVVSAKDAADLQGLLSLADALLYQAKADGRNVVRSHIPTQTD